jgi:hypothetical protein
VRRSILPARLLLVAVALAACATATAPSPPPPSPTPARTPVVTPTPRPTPTPTPAVSAEDLIEATSETLDQGSARIEFEIAFEDSNLIADGTFMSGKGQLSFAAKRQMVMSMDMPTVGLGSMDFLLDDRILFVRGTAFVSVTGDPETWLRINLDSDHPLAKQMGSSISGQNDSSLMVYYLYGLTGDISHEGRERVGGVVADHYAARLDLETALDESPDEVYELLAENIDLMMASDVDSEIGADVWIGEDGLVYRIGYTFDLGIRMGGGQMEAEMTFSDFGAPLEIDVPRRSEFVDVEDAAPEL